MTAHPNHPASRIDIDAAFVALSRRPRRRILASLVTATFRWQDELEAEASASADGNPKTAAIGLHHNHLPRLDAAGLVDWDRRTGLVTRGEEFEAIRPLLELLDGHRHELDAD